MVADQKNRRRSPAKSFFSLLVPSVSRVHSASINPKRSSLGAIYRLIEVEGGHPPTIFMGVTDEYLPPTIFNYVQG